MQVLSYHLALFKNLNDYTKNQPIDNLITLACIIALCFTLASYIHSYSIGKTVSTWLQFDISPFSYQSNSVIALILLCSAVPFLQPQAVFVQHITYFRQYIKNYKKKGYYTLYVN